MESLTKEKSYCPTCGHVVAKGRTNLSSLEFRRLVHKMDPLEELIDNKENLYRFIKSSYNRDFADDFSNDLKEKINSGNLDAIKLWLLGFVNNKNLKEIALYKFLLSTYLATNMQLLSMPFAEFYNNYEHWTNIPMSKNRVSRALSAFGLKPVMKRVPCNGKLKCAMVLSASKEELLELQQKNGLDFIPIP
jgi:hypothetical protein